MAAVEQKVDKLALRSELVELKQRVQALEQRIAELEAEVVNRTHEIVGSIPISCPKVNDFRNKQLNSAGSNRYFSPSGASVWLLVSSRPSRVRIHSQVGTR